MRCMRPFAGLLLALLLAWTAVAHEKDGGTYAVGDLRNVGVVHFPTSCDPTVQADFERAVALLHSFFYQEARRGFSRLTERDPNCAMADWGIAMTYYHQIWSPPKPDELALGRDALNRARAVAGITERERGFIEALTHYYGEDGGAASGDPSCQGAAARTHRCRAIAYKEAMGRLRQRYPEDLEVTVFYALALLGNTPRGTSNFENPIAAGEMLEKLLVSHVDHPGIAHYLIHSYDYPALAAKALAAARGYAQIAPWVPHALHMPSHIFTRLGMWQESIASNLASATAARAYARESHPGRVSFEEFHALDYLVYAYLQTGQDHQVRHVLARLAAIKATQPTSNVAVAYAAGAIPARDVMERHQWADAAQLEVPPASYWRDYPFAEAHIHYARGVGAARIGKVEIARQSMARLQELHDAVTVPKFQIFARHVEIKRMAVAGWIARVDGRHDEAVALLRDAAGREEALGKPGVGPGFIFPVRELLGDLLLELERPEEALAAYESSLAIHPNRYAALFGAAHAADIAGQAELARSYYLQVVDVGKLGNEQRVEMVQAREFLANLQP